MFDYIGGFFRAILYSPKVDRVTAAPNHLFDVQDYSLMIHPIDAKI